MEVIAALRAATTALATATTNERTLRAALLALLSSPPDMASPGDQADVPSKGTEQHSKPSVPRRASVIAPPAPRERHPADDKRTAEPATTTPWLDLRGRVRAVQRSGQMTDAAVAGAIGYSTSTLVATMGKRSPPSQAIMAKLAAWVDAVPAVTADATFRVDRSNGAHPTA